MSWLARSIANSLRLDEEEDEPAEEDKNTLDHAVPRITQNGAVIRYDQPRESNLAAEDRRMSDSDGDGRYNHGGDCDHGRGVKEDLSELRDSLTRQLWGVASFLAPPPLPPPLPPPPFSQRSGSSQIESKSDVIVSGDADDEEEEELVEYVERESGQFGEVPNFKQSGTYYTNIFEDAVGITEEALAFARNIAHHPETWLDFPLSEEDEFDETNGSKDQCIYMKEPI